MEKMDARKRYTQMVLKQSFLKLLKEKPVNRITVKEVCALAQLNRATFYAHYSDCFALMESIENELIDAFEKSLRYASAAQSASFSSAPAHGFFAAHRHPSPSAQIHPHSWKHSG